MKAIKGLIFDLDGVLYEGDRVVPGAVEAVEKLKQRYPVRFVTNTTRKTHAMVLEKLDGMGFDIAPDEVFTALDATERFLRQHGSGAFLLLTDTAKASFSELPEKIDFVVVGDAYTNFTYENMNEAFRHLEAGASLVAVAKNRYFKDKDAELSLDAGGFVAALEYATGQEAQIIGKPSRDFFRLSADSMGVDPESVLMVGDDIEADVLGAQRAGMAGVQVRTGKFKSSDLEGSIRPDAVIDDITQLEALLRG
jgi:HAD superfamily hydrolase (TIGR01458 family)